MLKIKKKKKYIKIILGAVAVCSCFFGVGLLQQTEQERNVNISAYEQFDGNVYDPQRLEPIDMMQLQTKWKNQVMADAADTDSFLGARTVSNASAKESVPGWVTRYGIGKREVRYYTDDRHFVIGWQYLQKDGLWDWYYFAEDTGYLLSDTVIDGVVLSRDGYAISVSATTEETLQAAGLAAHCEEVVVQNTILVTEEIAYTKDMKLIGGTENPVSIQGTAMEENVLSVLEQAVLTVASNVEVSTNGNAQNAIHVQEQAQVHCHGTVGDLDESTAQCGILASGEDTVVFLYPGATVTGANVGIYSQGETVLLGTYDSSVSDKLTKWLPGGNAMATVQATSLNILSSITGNTDTGVVQDGGTLTMKGAKIYNNGTLGGYGVTGSYGGGVCLKNGAVMDMTYGNIAGNRAVYGGGIYVDTGCTLNLKGGVIGGTELYNASGSNTTGNGNYVRENRLSSNGYKYAYGGGGGIYSKGTINAASTRAVKIAYNSAEGSIGGGGVLLAAGNAHFSGEILIYSNQVYPSAASNTSNLAGNDDINGEGAGIRIGTEEEGSVVNCTINCENATDFPEVEGEVKIYNNSSTGDGGGIHVSSNAQSQLVVKGSCAVYSNTSAADGGGGIKTNGGAVYLYGTALYSNTAQNHMGGGLLGAGIVDLEGCTIYNNHAGKEGGAVAFFNSSQGVAGNGYLHGCMVYDNTSGADGAGVAVMNGATGRVQGDSHVYDNGSQKPGVYCDASSDLILSKCYIYGNTGYGVANKGRTEVSGSAVIGFSAYEATDNYIADSNANGGFYNTGTLQVTDSLSFLIYGGESTALHNAGGNVTFEDGSGSRFYGKDGAQVVWNQGRITTEGKGFLFSPLIVISGDGVTCGVNNDGGSLIWRGEVKGSNRITETGITSDNVGGLTYGLYNQNGGVIQMQEGAVSTNQTGIYNASGSKTYLTGGVCQDSVEYGIYCETGSQLYMAEEAAVDTSNTVFLEPDCYIDINGALTTTGVIAVLDTKAEQDRMAGRIMATVSYAGGTGAGELYNTDGSERFVLAYETVDGGTPAFLLDGSQLQGIGEAVAATIAPQDIYLSTLIEESGETSLTAWLYDRTAWLREQMAGNKTDAQYQYFLAGDTGVITFTSTNMSDVSIIWPSTGGVDELKSYDLSGTQVVNETYVITALTDDIAEPYENSTYQFQIPAGTPEGTYRVTVVGTDLSGKEWNCILQVNVGDKRISGTFRTRIR